VHKILSVSVYKCDVYVFCNVIVGAMVRIDTTLLGFEGSKWERGSRSFVFKIEGMTL